MPGMILRGWCLIPALPSKIAWEARKSMKKEKTELISFVVVKKLLFKIHLDTYTLHEQSICLAFGYQMDLPWLATTPVPVSLERERLMLMKYPLCRYSVLRSIYHSVKIYEMLILIQTL